MFNFASVDNMEVAEYVRWDDVMVFNCWKSGTI